MAKQTVNVGTSASDGTGDDLRVAFTKINQNFEELYSGNVQVTAANILVYSVAGRTGNVVLSVNDISGGVSKAYVNQAIAANIAGVSGATYNAINANVAAANLVISDHSSRIDTLESNASSQALSIINLQTDKADVSYVDTSIDYALSNSAIAANLTVINANITAANAAIAILQSNASSQATTLDILLSNAASQGSTLNSLLANAASQNNDIVSLQGNTGVLASYIISLDSNSSIQESEIAGLRSNINSANIAIINLTSNASIQDTEIADLRANIIAANIVSLGLLANAASQEATLNSLLANAASQGSTLNSLLSNAASQQTTLDTLLSNAASQATTLDTLLSNAASQQATLISLQSNAASQEISISNLTTNAGIQSANISTIFDLVELGNVGFGILSNSISTLNSDTSTIFDLIELGNVVLSDLTTYSANVSGAVFTGNIQAEYILSDANVIAINGIFESVQEENTINYPNLGSRFIGNVDSYYQVLVQNLSSSENASTELVLTADAGNDDTNYITVGINSSNYNLQWHDTIFYESPLDGFVECVGGNISLRTLNNVFLTASNVAVALLQDGPLYMYNTNLMFSDFSIQSTAITDVPGLYANIGSQRVDLDLLATDISTLNANVGTIIGITIPSLDANVGTITDVTIPSLDANVGTITNNLATLDANVGAQLYTMGNYQNWTSNVYTISSALDQLAERIKNLGG